MELLCKKYLNDKVLSNLKIFDIGSMDINGSYRKIFDNEKWTYFGVDMQVGNNVDIAVGNPYRWDEIKSSSADVVISGQAFEHIEYFWLTMLEIERILKPCGKLFLIAPSSGPEHGYPVDCWRFYKDGMIALAKFADLKIIEAGTQWSDLDYSDCSNQWHDSFLICEKQKNKFLSKIKKYFIRYLLSKII